MKNKHRQSLRLEKQLDCAISTCIVSCIAKGYDFGRCLNETCQCYYICETRDCVKLCQLIGHTDGTCINGECKCS